MIKQIVKKNSLFKFLHIIHNNDWSFFFSLAPNLGFYYPTSIFFLLSSTLNQTRGTLLFPPFLLCPFFSLFFSTFSAHPFAFYLQFTLVKTPYFSCPKNH